MSGLGLSDFLTHNKDSGGRKFLRNWKDDGSIVVWLSTRASIAYPSWSHGFNYRGTEKDKEGNEREVLRFTRFVSPDPEIIHKEQYFREDGEPDLMKKPPVKDPFLLLREWLRHECKEPLDATVFQWENPATEETVKWKRGTLARLVDRTKATRFHSLDTKLEYLHVVVDNDSPEDGPQIVRCAKLLGDCMKKTIGAEMESNGDKGNPLLHPYAFKWVYDKKAKNFNESYGAHRLNTAKLTDEIREAITKDDFPDPSREMAPRAGDKARIRAAMEDAARIDIPWDRIFVDAWEDDEDDTDFNYGENAKKKNGKGERTPDVSTKSKRASDESDDEGEKPKRRKKKSKKEEPPPEPERIACDDCGYKMLPTEAKCPKCGAEYEIDGDGEEESDSAEDTDDPKGEKAETSSGSVTKCWSCSSTKIKNDRCENCGLDLSGESPFGEDEAD